MKQWIRTRLRNGIRGGFLLGAVYAGADVASAFAALHSLYDPGWPSIALILFTVVTILTLGGFAGALLGGVVPWRPRSRTRRTVAVVVAVTVFVLGIVLRSDRSLEEVVSPEASAESVPILFVLVDTTRADSLYGSDYEFPLAPKTRDWAQSSVVFEDAESTAGWTIPSMSAILTGVHNATFDASAGYLPESATTLAEHLAERGYETRAVVDNVILEPGNGFGQGFMSFEQRSAFRFAFTFPAFRLWPIGVHEWLRGSLFSAYDGSEDVTNVAIATIERAAERPLFLYVHYMDPHAPYYEHVDLPPAPGEPINYYRFRDYLRAGLDRPPSVPQLEWLRGRYEREINHWDEDFGRLLDAWHERFGDRGLVVLTSDHGEEFLDHGRLGHGMTVHREMVHVPMIIEAPAGRCRAGGRVSELVSTLDITPTVIEWSTGRAMTQPQVGPSIQGQSWFSWMCGKEDAPRRLAFARHSRHGRRVFRLRDAKQVALRTHYFNDSHGDPELSRYSFVEDPRELDPLPDDDGGAFHETLSKTIDAFEGADARAEASDDESKAVEESLRALGYIE